MGVLSPLLSAGADAFKGAAVNDVEVPESPPLKEPLKPTAPPPTRWQVWGLSTYPLHAAVLWSDLKFSMTLHIQTLVVHSGP